MITLISLVYHGNWDNIFILVAFLTPGPRAPHSKEVRSCMEAANEAGEESGPWGRLSEMGKIWGIIFFE
jgi:hypothetical protein